MNWLYVLRALPEIIKLIKSMVRQMEVRGDAEQINKPKEVKKNLDRIAQAIEEGDEKKLNDVFNSL